MKKLIIIPTVFLGIIGGYALAQSEIFSSAEKASTITATQAKEAALKAFDGKIVEFEYDHDDSVPHYDFEIVGATEKVDLEVDAATGDVTITERETVKNNAQPAVQQVTGQAQEPTAKPQTNNPPASSKQSSGIITKAQAIAIAQQKANGTVTEVEYDSDDYEYEIEIKNGNIEYDFEIDARTGAILSYEEDIDD